MIDLLPISKLLSFTSIQGFFKQRGMKSFQSNLYVDTNFFAFILTRYSYTNVILHIIKEVEKGKTL